MRARRGGARIKKGRTSDEQLPWLPGREAVENSVSSRWSKDADVCTLVRQRVVLFNIFLPQSYCCCCCSPPYLFIFIFNIIFFLLFKSRVFFYLKHRELYPYSPSRCLRLRVGKIRFFWGFIHTYS